MDWFLGSGAVASIGVSGNFMYLANGLVNMPKIGSQALVGQSLGANNQEQTKIIFRQLFKVPYFCPYIWDYYYCFSKVFNSII